MNQEYISAGIDVELISRFEKLPYKENLAFYRKIFTEKEIEYCLKRGKPSQHFAARFAAKEAIFKALSGFSVIVDAKQIEIFLNEKKAPYVHITNDKIAKNGKFGGYEITISMSHSGDYAIANAIVYKKS